MTTRPSTAKPAIVRHASRLATAMAEHDVGEQHERDRQQRGLGDVGGEEAIDARGVRARALRLDPRGALFHARAYSGSTNFGGRFSRLARTAST